MSSNKKNPEALSSIIGADAVLEGSFTLDGSLRVDGTFNGILICGGAVSIGKHGRVTGDIEADEVILGGRVSGTVIARRRVVLEGSSMLEGDLATGSLLVSEGAVFNGTSTMGDEAVERLRKQRRENRGTPEISSRITLAEDDGEKKRSGNAG
ncbi:polymer-forming cytoskeletal protein [bacterium]|nr:polymer-forming cytoskeletal protein [bacterium]